MNINMHTLHFSTTSDPRRSDCLRTGVVVEPQLVITEMTPRAPAKQSPTLTMTGNNLSSGVVVEADGENDVGCFSLEEVVSNSAGLCDHYRQVLSQYVSLHSTMYTHHASNGDDDGGESLASSFADMEMFDELEGDNVSLCDLESLVGSFLSGVDSIKIRRRQIRQSPNTNTTSTSTSTTATISSSAIQQQDLIEKMDDLIVEELDDDDDDDDMDSLESSETVYSFDLTYMASSE